MYMNGDFNGTLPAKGDLKTSSRAVSSSRLGVKKDFRLTLRITCQGVIKTKFVLFMLKFKWA